MTVTYNDNGTVDLLVTGNIHIEDRGGEFILDVETDKTTDRYVFTAEDGDVVLKFIERTEK